MLNNKKKNCRRMFVNNVTEGWKHLQSVKEEQLKKQVYQNTCIILGCEVATLRNPFFFGFFVFLITPH